MQQTTPTHRRDTRMAGLTSSSGPRLWLGVASLALLTACDTPFDFDLRDLGNGFDTSAAVQQVPERPSPDNRGVISYPNYQVVVAQRDDTVRTIARRLGFDADGLAVYNGIDPDLPLRRDEIIALPSRVSEPSAATGAIGSGPILPAGETIDVTTLASSAIDRVEGTSQSGQTMTMSPPSQSGAEPIRHQVQTGETVYSIARTYSTSVEGIATWNGLGPDLAVRQGQFLLVPVGDGSEPPVTVTATPPGAGSVAPEPPSAAQPLPAEVPAPAAVAAAAAEVPEPSPAPDLSAQQTAPSEDSAMVYPVQGRIIREYSKGRNDGIDIGAPAGTDVKAAADGTVAAITTDTAGIQIVVIRHEGNLLTVYTHLDSLSVRRDEQVSRGQTIGKVQAGDPSYLHFEVRRGTESADPADFLP